MTNQLRLEEKWAQETRTTNSETTGYTRGWPGAPDAHQWPLSVESERLAPRAGSYLMWAVIEALVLRLWCAAPSRWWRVAK